MRYNSALICCIQVRKNYYNDILRRNEMAISKNTFIRKYSQAIREGNAGIFAGAGLSRKSGYVDWKNLLRPLAKEVSLDIEKENDYLSVAQFYRNESGTRTSINQEILEAFNIEVEENENIDIIARLPISTYWTTNYDKLIEKELEKKKRKVDVKMDSDQLSNALLNRDAVVYKMHGDVDHPANAVLTKDDYVLYDIKRPFFKTVLKGDLISKKFLFVGFSFEDPNLDYVLGQIHALMDENVAEHYCFFRKVQRSDYSNNEDYVYEKTRQELRIKDLARYGIQTVYVDNYLEITEILLEIEFVVKRNNVFISGSLVDSVEWKKDKAEELARNLAESLVKNNFKITSGFGFGIGSSVINGALSEIYQSKFKHIDEYLCLWPFPQGIKDSTEQQDIFTQYRKDMIYNTGIAVFMFGNKKDPMDSSKIIDAPGCWEEFNIARDNKNIVIPIGSTGFMARKIFDEVKANIENYKYLEKYIDILEKEKDVNKIVEIVTTVAKEQRMA